MFYHPYIQSILQSIRKNVDIKTFFKVDLKHFMPFVRIFICSGRWLKTFMLVKYVPLQNFARLTIGKCRLLLYLVLYL